ncbi:MAG: peptidoglycan DD-metalloendopeptidase family protein [Oleiphilaceae bacterium]|nr:peptidoglycan DD-metalloendopeptidase family protein [Oleiphilaceae bacterium]
MNAAKSEHRCCHPRPRRALLWLALLGALLFGGSSPALADEDVSPAQLEQLKRNIAKLDRWLSKANSEKSGLVKELEKQEKDIAYISHRLRQLKVKNKELEESLTQLKANRIQESRALEQQKHALIQQLRAIYRQGGQPALKLLLDNNDPQDAARYLHYFSYLSKDQETRIENFKASIARLEHTEKNILTQQTALQRNREQLSNQLSELKERRATRAKVLAKLDDKLKTETQRLDKLKADQSRLEELLREVEQAIADLPLPDDARPFHSLKAKLTWPAKGKIQEHFGERVAQGKLRSNGIRIATRDEQSVQAIHYGRVIFSDWLRGFGLLIIIDHGGGYMSLYGNNKSLLKETGDWVRAGDIIAYSGDSGGKQESGLYFEIRKQGKPQNPLHWLRKNGNRP